MQDAAESARLAAPLQDRADTVSAVLSFVIPVFNEVECIGAFHGELAHPGRIRRHLQPATVSGAALDARLRTSPRRSPRPERPNQPPESPSRWIEVGGNVKDTQG